MTGVGAIWAICVGLFCSQAWASDALLQATLPDPAAHPAPGSVDEPSRRFVHALEVLNHTAQGRDLLLAAQRLWKSPLGSLGALSSHLQFDSVSRTDAVLTRHYDRSTGAETHEREVTVFIKKSQSLQDLVLDIAHELTHATGSPSWDPYDPDLDEIQYMLSAIDGPGGEVDALMSECRVAFELQERFGAEIKRCDSYLEDAQERTISRNKIRADFYRVGKWYPELQVRLGERLEELGGVLSSSSPALYSSTGRAPYPVALLEEYRQITEIACENSRKRAGRGLAGQSSDSPQEGSSSDSRLKRLINGRCRVLNGELRASR